MNENQLFLALVEMAEKMEVGIVIDGDLPARQGQHWVWSLSLLNAYKSADVMISAKATALQNTVTLAHELGHHADLMVNWKFNCKGFEKESNLISESIAWLYAVDLLKQVGFTEWGDFHDRAGFCLGSYMLGACSFREVNRVCRGIWLYRVLPFKRLKKIVFERTIRYCEGLAMPKVETIKTRNPTGGKEHAKA